MARGGLSTGQSPGGSVTGRRERGPPERRERRGDGERGGPAADSPDTLFEFFLDVFVEGIAARARRRGP
ncbi:hypothetical protein GCM10011583_21210 [Streptomyces camponoticapitis]|uniref:Uncharacterized protein n=1 Tax=Streptomyces camponoticapitis TaxID=1616125 RepID=A0ABQ2E4Z9_9ACTN|nr:hypothetical protein GCM10011583_21210 [Streptomyces camponoticapitis]